MTDKLTIYYSVANFGDGSAYPIFFNTKELAEWHQNHLLERWGEPCTGEIVVKGDNLSCPELETKESYYLTLLLEDENEDEAKQFLVEFFPDGLPEFTVKIVDPYHYGIFVKEKLVYKDIAYPETKANKEGAVRLAQQINCQDGDI